MYDKKLRVATVSPKIYVGNPTKNGDEIINILESIKSDNINVIVFPELCLTGCTCGDLFFHKTLIEACELALVRIIEYSKPYSYHIIIGAPLNDGKKLYNAAFHIYKGQIVQVVSKRNLSNTEQRWFSTGYNSSIDMYDYNILIGDDFYSDKYPTDLVINIAATPALVTAYDKHRNFVNKFTADRNCAYIYSSAGPNESTTDYVYSGSCLIADNGKIIAEGKRFSFDSEITIAEVSLGNPNKDISPIKIEKYVEKNQINPFIPSNKDDLSKRCEEIIEIQCTGLAKRMLHIHCNKLVLGISGGLDSTHALLVAVESMKKLNIPLENLICITMPGFGTTDLTYTNACSLVKSLGATLIEINIKNACLQHFKDIGHNVDIHDVTYENTQARERTQILMDYANKIGALVVGTGDLSELALGWCTYNGDHMSMYGVNGSVPKTLMRHLVRYIADNSDQNVSKILYSVIDTPVSPELLPLDKNGKMVQKTENTIGPYDVHDYFIYHFIRHHKSPAELLKMSVNTFKGTYSEEELRDWLGIFIKRFFNNQFKRSCIPDGVAVGTVSLSPRGAFIMPSDAYSDEWLKF
ncbi:MAG: NAD(+) synthase [Clostridia bacterium]|nr:NAD(+) synthase [Clostridia bacterium]